MRSLFKYLFLTCINNFVQITLVINRQIIQYLLQHHSKLYFLPFFSMPFSFLFSPSTPYFPTKLSLRSIGDCCEYLAVNSFYRQLKLTNGPHSEYLSVNKLSHSIYSQISFVVKFTVILCTTQKKNLLPIKLW